MGLIYYRPKGRKFHILLHTLPDDGRSISRNVAKNIMIQDMINSKTIFFDEHYVFISQECVYSKTCLFLARVGIYDIKDNFKKKYDGKLSSPFGRQSPELFEHIFKCNSGILCKKSLKGTALYEFVTMKDMQKTKEIGKFLVTDQKYREIFL